MRTRYVLCIHVQNDLTTETEDEVYIVPRVGDKYTLYTDDSWYQDVEVVEVAHRGSHYFWIDILVDPENVTNFYLG